MDIKSLRERHGISQAELATMLGVTQSTICRFERGDLPMNLRTIIALEAIDARGGKATPQVAA